MSALAWRRSLAGVLGGLLLGLGARASGAAASVPPTPAAAHFSITAFANPTHFKPGDPADFYTLIVRNDGGAATDGSSVSVADALPPGIAATNIEGVAIGTNNFPLGALSCELTTLSCIYSGTPALAPNASLWVQVRVAVGAGAQACPSCQATVSGGGAPTAAASDSTDISGEAAPFGFARFGLDAVNADGEPDTQAGSHPFEMTTSFVFNVAALDTEAGFFHDAPALAADPRELDVSLPPGLVGDANAVPRCSQAVFESTSGVTCPADTQVGTITFDVDEQAVEGFPHEDANISAVYNIAPPAGQPAELGFVVSSIRVHTVFHVRSDGVGDYGLTAVTPSITQARPLLLAMLTIWGVPADPSHDDERLGALRPGGGEECTHVVERHRFETEEAALRHEVEAKTAEIEAKESQRSEAEEKGETERAATLESERREVEKERVEVELRLAELQRAGPTTEAGCPSDVPAKPFLRMPTGCQATPLTVGAQVDSWAQPEAFVAAPSASLGPLTGCEEMSFNPTIAVEPESAEAGAPSSYTVHLRVPQDEEPGGQGTPDVRRVSVALPLGTAASPSATDGLQACSDEQFARLSTAPAACPAASQIGTVLVRSPLLPSPGTIEGQLYLGAPACEANGVCTPADAETGRMVRLFLQASGFGVTIKLEGNTSLNQADGQLTTTFQDDPQLPFEEVTLKLNAGARAPLANPTSCGTFTTTSAIEPWSGTTPASPQSQFTIAGCAAAQFAPAFAAGALNGQAGAFSPFVLDFSRTPRDQELRALTAHLPPGLLGTIANVVQCPEPQAAAGSCPEQSQIGTTTVASGPGPAPIYLGGRVYLTGPYRGAPFGLSIVVPVQAGPFNLGDVVVRASIGVDRSTSAITVTSDPIPSIVDGVPTQIRSVAVNVDRPRFMFNATDCAHTQVAGTLSSEQGASAPVASGYEAANCANLPFKPRFSASTSGHASKAGGASLLVKVGSKGGPGTRGEEANIKAVKVDLPKQLPSRQSTLKLACTDAVFEANPADCPKESAVGTAVAVTPVLSHPLRGPAYLVSHGGAAFPDLEIVLQGEGVTLVLDGQTHIDGRTGITSSIFKALPDAPISSFELTLPRGAYSALAVNLRGKHPYDLCGRRLRMPTEITGQNGAVLKQTTAVAVTGCPKHKPKKRVGTRKRHARTRQR